MSDCPHPDFRQDECIGCPDHPCARMIAPALPLPRVDCNRCYIARGFAEMMRRAGEEEAWQSGDMPSEEWRALQERTR